jgi:hypothetical protein
MDSGKLAKLKDVKWRAARCCATCVNGKFSPGKDWGTCGLDANTYEHNKHKRLHELPAHVLAVCDYYYEDKFEGAVKKLNDFLSSPITS